MSNWLWMGAAVAVLLGVLAIIVRRPLRRIGRELISARARESFQLQRERLESIFFQAAASTGKPRGLRWKRCEFEPTMDLARDQRSSQLLALVPVTISFEAIEGSAMEGVEAVGNLRSATAVFVYERGHWTTAGRAIFNMSPAEALSHFGQNYVRVPG